MTQEQADALIDYLEAMEKQTRHDTNMRALAELGWAEKELACRALGKIAGRDYSIL